jgi:ABC-type transport system involved in multi-copper enzyme maturation permease subunit
LIEFILSGLRSGIRGRSVQGVFVLGLALIAVAYLAAGFSPRQPRTVALDVGFSGVRFTLILLSLFWVQDLVTREIDRKIILHSLSLPVSRGAFLFGRYLAVLGLVGLAAGILALCLLLAVLLASPNYDQEFSVNMGWPFWLAIVGIVLDVAIVAAVALALATVSTVSMLPLLVGAAFAIGGKALGAAVDYIAGGAGGDQELKNSIGPWLDIVRWVMPDLSRLDWRDGALYGAVPPGDAVAWAIVMAMAYVALVLGLGWRALDRREFG